MDDAEIIWRADANYHAVSALLASGHDGGEARERDGLLVINTGLPIAAFNVAFVTRPLTEPEGLVREAAAYYDGAGLPFIVRVRDGLDPAAERACEAIGLPYGDTVPGMALAPIAQARGGVAGLEVRPAQTGADFDTFFDIVCGVFDFPIEMAHALFTEAIMRRPDAGHYIGYLDGEAVATSTLVATHRTAGIFNVATRPDFRGRGIGEAMTWACVRRGAEMGCVMAALQASEMGRPVYERMGFRLVAPYRTFHRPGA
jgi:ribosomal protein S18 acetylase RimI-like enzyme